MQMFISKKVPLQMRILTKKVAATKCDFDQKFETLKQNRIFLQLEKLASTIFKTFFYDIT